MNPYLEYIREFSRITSAMRECQGHLVSAPRVKAVENGSKILVFAPHPDDESITGALPLRFVREAGMSVTVVAVTLGSNVSERKRRFEEMVNACSFLGFDLLKVDDDGLSCINLEGRKKQESWNCSVQKISKILTDCDPSAIILPHSEDANSTHIGVHHLVIDALRKLGSKVKCNVIESEYWRAMKKPNLMIESSEVDVADLVAATAMHIGEVQRNPYHVLLPAWMQDNVRRGAETVGAQGKSAPEFIFCTLYRIRKWHMNKLVPVYKSGRQIPITDKFNQLIKLVE